MQAGEEEKVVEEEEALSARRSTRGLSRRGRGKEEVEEELEEHVAKKKRGGEAEAEKARPSPGARTRANMYRYESSSVEEEGGGGSGSAEWVAQDGEREAGEEEEEEEAGEDSDGEKTAARQVRGASSRATRAKVKLRVSPRRASVRATENPGKGGGSGPRASLDQPRTSLEGSTGTGRIKEWGKEKNGVKAGKAHGRGGGGGGGGSFRGTASSSSVSKLGVKTRGGEMPGDGGGGRNAKGKMPPSNGAPKRMSRAR